MTRAIEVQGLKKSYGEVEAVKGIDFYVDRGTLFAFLGPNGAGKSTTIDILCTLLKPDEGDIKVAGYVLGRDDDRIRTAIGAVFQRSVLDNELTVIENLYIRGRFYNLSKQYLKKSVETAAQAAGVTGFLNRRYDKLSGGQRRRADIARALVHTPDILFLDEPTTGLDPQTRKSVWETVRDLQRERGVTVFLTTHYMEEAAGADYVVIIDEGRIAAKGTPFELKEKYSKDRIRIEPADLQHMESRLRQAGMAFETSGGIISIEVDTSLDAIPIIDGFRDMMKSFEVVRGTMDDVFITVTGMEIRE
jgi:multidrug/hemolysin transport system ATP-binding protein